MIIGFGDTRRGEIGIRGGSDCPIGCKEYNDKDKGEVSGRGGMTHDKGLREGNGSKGSRFL